MLFRSEFTWSVPYASLRSCTLLDQPSEVLAFLRTALKPIRPLLRAPALARMSSSATPLSDEAAFAAASTPSRAGAGGGGKAAKGKKGNSNVKEKPDYMSPPPANAQERRDWERMATRMEGFHSYVRSWETVGG